MTALQPAASRSIDRPGVRCPCQGAPSEREMTIGQGLESPNQPNEGRITTCQAGLEPDLSSGARSVTVVGNRGEPSGESQIKPSDGCGRDADPLAVEWWYNFPEFGCHLGNVEKECMEVE